MSCLGGLNAFCTGDPYFIEIPGGCSGLRQILQSFGEDHNILVIPQYCSREPLKDLSSCCPQYQNRYEATFPTWVCTPRYGSLGPCWGGRSQCFLHVWHTICLLVVQAFLLIYQEAQWPPTLLTKLINCPCLLPDKAPHTSCVFRNSNSPLQGKIVEWE